MTSPNISFLKVAALGMLILFAASSAGCTGSNQEVLEMQCINSVAHDYLYSTNFTEENKEYALHYAISECHRESTP